MSARRNASDGQGGGLRRHRGQVDFGGRFILSHISYPGIVLVPCELVLSFGGVGRVAG
jgi:hypothetical protein